LLQTAAALIFDKIFDHMGMGPVAIEAKMVLVELRLGLAWE
jgi:hypothetical protein